MKVSLVSLGCAKNLVDSEVMLQLLADRAFEFTDEPKQAEIIIVNTCGFIEPAKRESIDTILELVELKKKGQCQLLIVTGCLVQRYAQDLAAEIPEIDVLLGTGDYHRIVEVIQKAKRESVTIETSGLINSLAPDFAITSKGLLSPPHTSYIKIAEGCNNRCSYCIIPALRGPLRSRPAESVLKEAEFKLAEGVQELILVAQDLTQYGIDHEESDGLANLLNKLDKIAENKWVRLLYTYPHGITNKLIENIADSNVICHYLDIPMQHGNDEILKRMNRRDRKKDMIALVRRLRKEIPDIAIRSSFIVGFPGETESQFQEMLEFLEEIQLDRAGFFHYSQEEGTPAGQMKGQISKELKEERFQRALEWQDRITYAINRKLIGTEMKVLIEEKSDNLQYPLIGRSYRDAPEVDGQVHVLGFETPVGKFANVHLEFADASDLFGSILNNNSGE